MSTYANEHFTENIILEANCVFWVVPQMRQRPISQKYLESTLTGNTKSVLSFNQM